MGVVAWFASDTVLATENGSAGDNSPPDDRATLVALYDATGGDDWTNNANWLSDLPIGEWHGVTTDDEGRVTRLNLSDNLLTGELPAELGSLSNLKWLYLHANQLEGELPAELGNLSNLRWLSLSGNRLTGDIPTELGKLSNMEGLWLNENGLTRGICRRSWGTSPT